MLNLDSSKLHLKNSDTIFILGSGPSLNTLSEEQISNIHEKNSFGISYSFLKTEIAPTFQIFSYETDGSYSYLEKVYSQFKHHYKKTAIILLDRAYFRFVHPKLMPNLFPDNPTCCYLRFPHRQIVIAKGEDLVDEVFDRGSFLYRGSMSTALHIAISFGYKKIVLIGVDLHTFDHFFDDNPIMQEHAQKYFSKEYYKQGKKFDSMYPKFGKELPFDQYLVKLEDYLKRKKGIQLYTSRKSDYMADRLPAYFEN